MREVNVFIDDYDSGKIDLKTLNEASYVVQMYDFKHEKTPPVEEGNNVMSWNLPNLSLYSFDSDEEEFAYYQELCDEIAMKVKYLYERIDGTKQNYTAWVM